MAIYKRWILALFLYMGAYWDTITGWAEQEKRNGMSVKAFWSRIFRCMGTFLTILG